MSSVADPRPAQLSEFRKAMILASVTWSTTLYAMSILIVSVVLPQMQGSLSATQDQISWVVTFNILATAVMTPMAGWLGARFGKRNVMLWCATIFGISTLLCGMAESLETLILYRIIQGGAGAPMVPMAQAIILGTYDKNQHSKAMAIYGMGVVVGPAIGPALGGYLAELYDWRWAFFMMVPISMTGFLGLYVFLRREEHEPIRFDWTGFVALSIALICLQLVLDRGNRLDWFESTEIVIETAIAAAALYVFCIHSATARQPFLPPAMLRDRNYALGILIVFVYGMLNFTPMVLMPPMLQGLMGFPDSIIGTLLTMRGVGAILGFFLAMWISKLDPRVGMTVGFLMQGASGWMMVQFNAEVTMVQIAITTLIQGVSVGIIWVPLTVATFATLSPRYLGDASAVYHLLRNIGSSIFISLSITVIIVYSSVNRAYLTEFVTPFNTALDFGNISSIWDIEERGGLAAISGEIDRQAGMIGYLNAFYLYTVACWAVIPLILMMRVRKTGT